jgi:hypothetical protein
LPVPTCGPAAFLERQRRRTQDVGKPRQRAEAELGAAFALVFSREGNHPAGSTAVHARDPAIAGGL